MGKFIFPDGRVFRYPDKPVSKSVKPAAKAAQSGNQPIVRTDNKLVNATARAGLLAQATAADNEAREHERMAEEKMEAIRNVSARDIINHYSRQAAEHRAHAELHRSRAAAHRRAAASL